MIFREIDIPIRRHRERVRPLQPRVPREYRDGLVRRVEDLDAVVLEITTVDEAVAIGFETIGLTLLPTVRHRRLGFELAREAAVAQALRGDAVQIAAADDAPVERRAIRAQSDTVGAEAAVGDGRGGAGVVVEGLAPDEGGDAELGAEVGGVVEVAPGLAGAEVDGDEAVAAFGAGVSHVGDALARGGEMGAEVEAHVVDVLGGGLLTVKQDLEGRGCRAY